MEMTTKFQEALKIHTKNIWTVKKNKNQKPIVTVEIDLSLLTQYWHYRHSCSSLVTYLGAGVQVQALLFVRRAST